MRLTSCKYCGRIHPADYDCGHRNIRSNTEAVSFRNTQDWQRKRAEIRQRDGYVCQACLRLDHHINSELIEVHHIVPLETDYDKRLDEHNLISLCAMHHKQAENGTLSKKMLISWTNEAFDDEETMNRVPRCKNI